MFHLVFHFFVFFLGLAFCWILFVLWIFGVIFRGIWTAFSRVTGIGKPRPLGNSAAQRCPGFRCRAFNPPTANFCRRCGAALSPAAAYRQLPDQRGTQQWASSPIS